MTVNIANINLGSGPDTNTGEPLRTAFSKVNNNFSNLKSAIDNISTVVTTGNLEIDGQTITGTLNNTDIVLDPAGSGKVSVVGNLTTSNLRFIGSTISTQYEGDLVLNASAGNVRLADPLKFADGTVQHSASVGNGGTIQTLTINDLQSALSNIITLNGHTANYEIYNWANGNPILSNVAGVAFTADYNDLINTPVIPTHTSNLTNDSGYITSAAVTWANVINRPTNNSDFANDSGFITSDALYWNNIQERPANVSAFTNDAGYITSSAIPSDVSAFNNDSGFITGAYVSWANVSGKPNFADIATSGSYSDLSGVPTTLSQFSNDTNFANVTYVDDRISNLIGGAPAALDTLKEIADSMANNTSLSSSLTTLIGTKANANAVVSSFTNDAGYITASTANVISVNGQTGAVTLDLNTYTDSNVAAFLSNYTGEINFIASPAIISGVGTITTQTANVTGNVNASGNVSASYFIGNGSQLTGLPASYTNSNVTSLLSSLGSNVISSTANVVTTANVSGNNVVGSYVVSTLGIYRGPAGSPQIEQGVGGVNWAGHLTLNTSGALIKGAGGTTVIQLGAVNSTDARIWGNLWVGSANTGNITGGNISTSGVITASGNVTASYFIGNGSQLTGLPASYTNSNVTSLLSAFGCNTITTTGNITAGNISGNINITGNITGTSTNVTLVAGSYSWTFDNAGNLSLPGNVFAVKYANGTTVSLGGVSSYGDSNVATLLASFGSSAISTTGNVTAGYFIGNGSQLTGLPASYSNSNVVTLLSSFGSNTLSTTGNVTAGNISVSGASGTGVSGLQVGVSNTLLSNTVTSFSANVNNYTQVTLQNKSTGADATADYIITADNGSDTVNYLDVGIINSGYDNSTPSNSLGNLVYAADSYIYAQGNASATSQSGGNLAIGTTVAGKTIKFFAGGANASSIVANISSTGLAVTGNITTTGNITGSAANVTITANSYVTTFDTSGTVTFPGTVSIPALPAFRVYGSGTMSNLSTTQNTNGILTNNNFTIDFQQGSGLVGSTGVFTCQVAGVYQVNMVVRTPSNNNSVINQAAVVKNWNGASGTIVCMVEFGLNTTMNHAGAGTVVKLAVGDTLVLKVTAGNISFDSNDNWSVAFLG